MKIRPRVIPCLLLDRTGFYKTMRFKNPVYLGDPINILKIFNEKSVDEIAILDIGATPTKRGPNYELLKDLASECFMPLAYGGGITSVAQMKQLFQIGFEKVILNTALADHPALVTDAAEAFGSQSVVACIDVKRTVFGGYEVVTAGARRKLGRRPDEWAKELESRGVGEIVVNSVDQDGTLSGYDLSLVKLVASAVRVPVIACGGARNAQDLGDAVKQAHASACGAGAMFVFQGRHRAVLINVPSEQELDAALG
ncbi:MAG: imidazole glycerol phosphate synthase subunit HisF [Opitutae bacterium]|nr:imidazole glycerol phosphate synthase subunit HisF [Opitutae bacterium]